jgi:hypothetical protein
VEPIAPREPVPFVTKGRHSILYQTAVDHLLRTRGVQRLVLAGQVAEQCILYSALDAYMRGYEMTVPADAVAHIDPELARAALTMMSRNVHANVSNAEALNLASWTAICLLAFWQGLSTSNMRLADLLETVEQAFSTSYGSDPTSLTEPLSSGRLE